MRAQFKNALLIEGHTFKAGIHEVPDKVAKHPHFHQYVKFGLIVLVDEPKAEEPKILAPEVLEPEPEVLEEKPEVLEPEQKDESAKSAKSKKSRR